jgi:hypothetical protein
MMGQSLTSVPEHLHDAKFEIVRVELLVAKFHLLLKIPKHRVVSNLFTFLKMNTI